MKFNTSLLYSCLLCICMTMLACKSNDQVLKTPEKVYISDDGLVIDNDIEIEPPSTTTPPPAPPVIKEMKDEMIAVEEEVVFSSQDALSSSKAKRMGSPAATHYENLALRQGMPPHNHHRNNEEYADIVENAFKSTTEEPLSTFSLDVDRASYSNVRRMMMDGYLPPVDAVRIEEMINYFNYPYAQPKGKHPIEMTSTLSECPWNEKHQVIHVGIQGKKIETENLPPSNLVFLLDVSGSMNSANKLPLVKSAFKLLLDQLRPEDKVAIVTYAGNAGVVLESTPATEKEKIWAAMKSLRPGGSTAGGQGIITAYDIAKRNFIDGGNNRVILATDGDFNVGVSSAEGLESLIEEKRKTNIFLSVMGFGTGNYKDHRMQVLANKGNGNHSYIDNMLEAQKTLVNEFGGSMFTIAKDVKIQIEFNPAYVGAYRLIGYENRLLNKEDFNDDTKDAGEIGSGISMTALYEIIPAGVESNLMASVDDLKYQNNPKPQASGILNNELATLKFRYKEPDGDKSKKIVQTIGPKANKVNNNSETTNFIMAVTEFGMLLRESNYLQESSIKQITRLAEDADGIKGKDEFLQLVQLYESLERR